MATRELKAAALAVAAAVSSATNHNTIACEAVAAVVVAVAADSDILGRNVPRKPNGRHLRTHLPRLEATPLGRTPHGVSAASSVNFVAAFRPVRHPRRSTSI